VTINKSDAYTYLFALALAYIPVNIANYILDPKGRRFPTAHWKKLWPTLVGVVMITLGIVPFNIAFSYGLASLVTPISSSYVIITVILAYFFLKEQLTKMHVIGIAVSVLGIVLLGIS
jgi:drug/metabolite transporter (DMT)-like permease